MFIDPHFAVKQVPFAILKFHVGGSRDDGTVPENSLGISSSDSVPHSWHADWASDIGSVTHMYHALSATTDFLPACVQIYAYLREYLIFENLSNVLQ